jgi:RND family efflux transporter MFP subunit
MSDLSTDLAGLRIERTPERRSSGRWVLWVLLVILLGGVGGAAAWWVRHDRPIEVQVAAVTQRAAGAQASVLNASGYVTARREATVSSKITGKVVQVNVEEGMAVTAGQVLARLDDASVRAQLALAQAQVVAAEHGVTENQIHEKQARINLDRATKLLASGAGPETDVEQAKLDVDTTEARISLLEEQVKVAQDQVAVAQTDLDNTVIRAPFSGIAITKDAQPGEMVSPVSAGGGFTRTGICTVVDMASLEIDVDVNESYLNRVKPDQDVTAILDAYPDWQIPAHVITIVPTADRQKATVEVRIAFKALDPRILPDMGVKVTFLKAPDVPTSNDGAAAPAPAQATTLVPKEALKTEGNATFVFVVKGNAAERRAVRIGGADGDRVEVVAGLASGDRVVISPPATLHDGSAIVVR